MFGAIEQTTLITYIAIVAGFVFIPGPATMLTMTRATVSGTKVGIATGAGVAIGDIIHTIMAIIGISALIATSALLFNFIKYAGAAYLIYLGITALLDNSAEYSNGDVRKITATTALNQAIVTEVLNPKTALFFLAFLPQFVRPENGAVHLQLLILGLIFVTLGLISTVIFAVGAGKLGSFLRNNPSLMRWQNTFAGMVFCALGIRLALQER